MTDIDLPGLLAFYRLSEEAWNLMLPETQSILRSRWTEEKKYYKGGSLTASAGGEKPDADPVLQTDIKKVPLTDGYALFGTDAQGIRYVGLYADDDRATVFVAEGGFNPKYASYMEIVEQLRGPTPYTVGLAFDVGTWSVDDVREHAKHLEKINSALEDVWKDPREETTTAELIQRAVDEALEEKANEGSLDNLYRPLARRMRHQHDSVIEE